MHASYNLQQKHIVHSWATAFAQIAGKVIEKKVEGGVLQCIFIQSAQMRLAFATYPEIQIIDGTFKVRLLLCLFHVLKYLKTKIYNEDMSKEGTDAVWSHIHPIVYAKSRAEYESTKADLYEICNNYQPRAASTQKSDINKLFSHSI